MARTPREVFAHHAEALGAGDLDGIVSDYREDAVFITPAGVQRGHPGIRTAFTQLLAELPQATWDLRPSSTSRTSCCWSGPPTPAPTGSTTAWTRSSSLTG
jgi:hypothetical protein